MSKILIEQAMKKAYRLGQQYWQRADSEAYSQQAKATETEQRFRELCADTCAALEAPQPPHECTTEAEKIAFAFGWWKALEANRAPQAEQQPKETAGFMSGYDAGMADGKRILKREKAEASMSDRTGDLSDSLSDREAQDEDAGFYAAIATDYWRDLAMSRGDRIKELGAENLKLTTILVDEQEYGGHLETENAALRRQLGQREAMDKQLNGRTFVAFDAKDYGAPHLKED